MTNFYGQQLQTNLISDVKSAWGLSDDVIYLEPPRSPLGIPYAVVQLDSFQQEPAYPDAVRGLIQQTYQFSVAGLFARGGSGNAADQNTKINAITSGLSAEPVLGIVHERYLSSADIQQTEFESEPAWLVSLVITYIVFEED